MNEQGKIILLVPYFGPWPPWVSYFLAACGRNEKISWVLISDHAPPGGLPANVRWEKMSLEAFSQRISRLVGGAVQVRQPYKLCDYRPAYGEIFSDLIGDFPFWGYCDADLVVGDLLRFFTPEILGTHDVFSVRGGYMSGHFALYRNDPRINALYCRTPGYRKVFLAAGRHFALDERSNLLGTPLEEEARQWWDRWRWHSLVYRGKKFFAPAIRDMTTLLRHMEKKEEIKWFHRDLVRSDKWYCDRGMRKWEILWEAGKLYDRKSGEELLHFHFLLSKRGKAFRHPLPPPADRFLITPAGFRNLS